MSFETITLIVHIFAGCVALFGVVVIVWNNLRRRRPAKPIYHRADLRYGILPDDKQRGVVIIHKR